MSKRQREESNRATRDVLNDAIGILPKPQAVGGEPDLPRPPFHLEPQEVFLDLIYFIFLIIRLS